LRLHELRADDAFWAAQKVMAFTDELIRAACTPGQYKRPGRRSSLAAVLIKRRDAIGRAYLPAVNPVVNPRLDAAGQLTFENAAVAAGFAQAPVGYRAAWFRFDNATGATQPIGETRSATRVDGAARRPRRGRGRQLRRNRHHRRRRGSGVVAAAGAHVLPPHQRRLEAGRPRAPA
jgi:hypothetical protein